MTLSSFMAISPLEGRYHDKLTHLRPIFSEYGLMKFRTCVEIRWLLFLSEHAHLPELPPLSNHAKKLLEKIIENFSEQDAARIKHIEAGINHDVKAIEYFIKEKIKDNAELEKINEFIHFAVTSEDINNLAYGLMLHTCRKQVILPALDEILMILSDFSHQYADQPMLARTHGQPATPTTVGKEFANFIHRLKRQILELNNVQILGKLNGASGNYNALVATYPDIDWQNISMNFVNKLDLIWNPYTTQIEPHDCVAEFFHVLIRINNILLDLTRDMWGYISLNYFQQKALHNEVGSSVMPHKINPIDFENAEGNFGIANALLDHMAMKLPISRFQRDLSDSTVLRNMGSAVAYAVLGYQSLMKGLRKVSVNTKLLDDELDQHWEILAEPIQTIMRKYKVDQAYEKLKELTRGHKVTKELLQKFIASLDIPDDAKKYLMQLTPAAYIGLATNLAKRI